MQVILLPADKGRMNVPPENAGTSLRQRWQQASRRVLERARTVRMGSRRVSQVSVASSLSSSSRLPDPSEHSARAQPLIEMPDRDLTHSPLFMAFLANRQEIDETPLPSAVLSNMLHIESHHNRPRPRLVECMKDVIAEEFPILRGQNLEYRILLAARSNSATRKATPDEWYTNVMSLLEALQIAHFVLDDTSLCTSSPELVLLQLWNKTEDASDRKRCQVHMLSLLQAHIQQEEGSVYEFPFSRSRFMTSMDELLKRADSMIHSSPAFKEWKTTLKALPPPPHLTETEQEACLLRLGENADRYFQQQFMVIYPDLLNASSAMKEVRRPLSNALLCKAASQTDKSLLAPGEQNLLLQYLQRSPWVHATRKSCDVYEKFTEHLIARMLRNSAQVAMPTANPGQVKAMHMIMNTCDLDLRNIQRFTRQLDNFSQPNELMAVFYRLYNEPKTPHRDKLMGIWVDQFEHSIHHFLKHALKENLEQEFKERLVNKRMELPDECLRAIRDEKVQLKKGDTFHTHQELKVFRQLMDKHNETAEREINATEQSAQNKAKAIKAARKKHLRIYLEKYQQVCSTHTKSPAVIWVKQQEHELWKSVREDFCEKLHNSLPWPVSIKLLSTIAPTYKMLGTRRPLEEWIHNRLPKNRKGLADSFRSMRQPEA